MIAYRALLARFVVASQPKEKHLRAKFIIRKPPLIGQPSKLRLESYGRQYQRSERVPE
jgi:hypothetical protein